MEGESNETTAFSYLYVRRFIVALLVCRCQSGVHLSPGPAGDTARPPGSCGTAVVLTPDTPEAPASSARLSSQGGRGGLKRGLW